MKDRWYLDASWTIPRPPVPALEELRAAPLVAIDLNHGHLAAWVITPDGNPAGPPATIPLDLAGLPATRRDGRLRAAISDLIRLARARGCHAIAVEDLNFTEARDLGRERSGTRPSRGKRGRAFRRAVAGIPTNGTVRYQNCLNACRQGARIGQRGGVISCGQRRRTGAGSVACRPVRGVSLRVS